tara:strand:+ start:527 stop:802 length:276 start_codon:yes stop_codon:yes gene_type:complete
LDFDQFLTSGKNNLSHLFESLLEFTEGLFRITVGPVLNIPSFLTAALNQRFTLLLRLLSELQSILMQSLRFSLSFFLQAKSFHTNLLELLE